MVISIRIAAILSTIVMLAVLVVGVLSNRTRAQREIEALEAAVERHTQTIDADPTNAQAYYDRAMIYRKLKTYEKAIADLTTVVELEPENALAYKYRGLTYAFLGDNERCATDYTKSLELGAETDSLDLKMD